MATALEGAGHLPRGGGSRTPEILRSRHVPLPLGSGSARRPSAGLHRLRHLRPLQAVVRIQRVAPDGLRRLRSAGRAIRHPDRTASGRHDGAEHRPLPRAAGQDRLLVRLEPRGAHLRPGLLPLDPVGVPADVRPLLLQRLAAGAAHLRTRRGLPQIRQRRAERRLHAGAALHRRGVEQLFGGRARTGAAELPTRLPGRHDGQLVPPAGNRACQRRGEGRSFGPRRFPRGTEAHEAVAAARDGLRPAHA